MLIKVTSSDFSSNLNIKKASKSGALLIVKQDWCGFCRRLTPTLSSVSKKLGSAYPIMTLDGDENPDMISKLGVEGFPTLFFIDRSGNIKKKYDGGRSEEELISAICSESLVCRK